MAGFAELVFFEALLFSSILILVCGIYSLAWWKGSIVGIALGLMVWSVTGLFLKPSALVPAVVWAFVLVMGIVSLSIFIRRKRCSARRKSIN